MATAEPVSVSASAQHVSLPTAHPRPPAPRRDVLSGSPRTPLLNRSISGAFGSPGSYSREPEEVLVYELSSRHFSAGFSGESRPRCISRFGYGVLEGRRVGDFHDLSAHTSLPMKPGKGTKYDRFELYRQDLRTVNLALAKDRFERVVRNVHIDYLQLDQKPRKATLVVSSLVPTKVLDLALDVLFNHYAQPPSITLLSRPAMTCLGAGLRNALVVDVGWEETTATVVGEYRIISERRSTRAGRMLSEALGDELAQASSTSERTVMPDFAFVEDIRDRLAWCDARPPTTASPRVDSSINVPIAPNEHVAIPFSRLSSAVESTYFAVDKADTLHAFDDQEHPLHSLAYEALLPVSADLRAACASRIILTGSYSRIPGLRRRLLQGIQHLLDTKRWTFIEYGRHPKPKQVVTNGIEPSHHANSTTTSEQEPRLLDNKNVAPASTTILRPFGLNYEKVYPPLKTSENTVVEMKDIEQAAGQNQVVVRPDWRPLDSVDFRVDMVKWLKDRNAYAEPTITPVKEGNASSTRDPSTQKVERELQRKAVQPFTGKVRGIETLGAWAGASILASLRVKGVHEIEREDFLKHGYHPSMANMI